MIDSLTNGYKFGKKVIKVNHDTNTLEIEDILSGPSLGTADKSGRCG